MTEEWKIYPHYFREHCPDGKLDISMKCYRFDFWKNQMSEEKKEKELGRYDNPEPVFTSIRTRAQYAQERAAECRKKGEKRQEAAKRQFAKAREWDEEANQFTKAAAILEAHYREAKEE